MGRVEQAGGEVSSAAAGGGDESWTDPPRNKPCESVAVASGSGSCREGTGGGGGGTVWSTARRSVRVQQRSRLQILLSSTISSRVYNQLGDSLSVFSVPSSHPWRPAAPTARASSRPFASPSSPDSLALVEAGPTDDESTSADPSAGVGKKYLKKRAEERGEAKEGRQE